MNFTLTILGTASAMPVSDRNPSAQALSVHGRLFLIDCGEGTQQQLRRSRLSLLKLEAVFLSHLHGDHVFGIFGLLSTLAMYGRTRDLDIYAPVSFGPVLRFFLSYFGEGLNYEIIHHPLKMKEPEQIHVSKNVTVSAFPLDHKIDCFGFRFDEVMTPRKIEAGVKPVSYAYCSDTRPFPELPAWVNGVSVLYHEATYPDAMSDKASMYCHSTTSQAAECALKAGAGRLIVGHYTSRERDNSIFQEECRKIFPESYAPRDGEIFEIDYIRKL